VFRATLIELRVLAGLILVIVMSITLLRRNAARQDNPEKSGA
jgi:hypothetical protein